MAKADDFNESAQINNLLQPRYILPLDEQSILVSQWGLDLLSGSIAVVRLSDNQVVQTISQGIGKGPERMLRFQNRIYVANVGGLELDNFISVIDASTLLVIDTVQVADRPNSLQIGSDARLWVACGGKVVYGQYPEIDTVNSTEGALVGINTATREIEHYIGLGKGQGAYDLQRDMTGARLFFRQQGAVYVFRPNTLQYETLFLGNYYGINYLQGQDLIYAAEYAGINPAWVYRHNPNSGIRLDSFKAGIFANGFYER